MTEPADGVAGAAEPADGEPVEATSPGADPTPSYPRGNRLGLRHPRPTVVIAIVVALLVGGAFVASRVRSRPTFCELTGAPATPTAGDADAAFRAWYDDWSARSVAGRDSPPPAFEDYESVGGGTWERVIDDDEMVAVEVREVAGSYRVTAVNTCRHEAPGGS